MDKGFGDELREQYKKSKEDAAFRFNEQLDLSLVYIREYCLSLSKLGIGTAELIITKTKDTLDKFKIEVAKDIDLILFAAALENFLLEERLIDKHGSWNKHGSRVIQLRWDR